MQHEIRRWRLQRLQGKTVKKQLINLAKYGLGFGVLAWVISSNWAPGGPGTGLSGLLKPPRLGPLVAASLIYLVSVLITFVRWYVLVRAQDLPFTLINALRLGLIGLFFSTCFPGSVGGDVVKAYCIAREQDRRTVAVATVVIDRVVGLWALFWLVVLSAAAFWLAGDSSLETNADLQKIVLGTTAVIAVSSVVCLVLMLLPQRAADWLDSRINAIPRLGHTLAQLWRAVWMYRNRWRSVLLALAMSLVGHCGFVLTFYFAAQVFLAPAQEPLLPSLAENFLVVPVGMAIQAGFPTPGGIGGGEAGFGWVYSLVGSPPVGNLTQEELGVAGSLTQRLITWVLGVIGYFVYLQMKPQIEVAEEAAAAAEANGDGAPLPESSPAVAVNQPHTA